MKKFKRGEVVKVYSLQSFNGGGFLNGVKGIVSQDQTGASVLVAVERKMGGLGTKIDPNYEVYPQQLERCSKLDGDALTQFRKILATFCND